MRIRGERECRECGGRWSYYDTGSVACPDCGSIASRGLEDERTLHTAGGEPLDLTPVKADVDEVPLAELAEQAKSVCREYVRQDGFVHAGELRPLDDVHLAARELAHAADFVGRSMAPDDAEERYLLDLLAGAEDGDRPPVDAVPASVRAVRGLAVAGAVRDYRRDLREWLEEPDRPAVEAPLAALDQHARRLAALQGDVPPADAERLVAATRDLAAALREDDEDALAAAADRLDRLASPGEGDRRRTDGDAERRDP